jgi:hypothetical protein
MLLASIANECRGAGANDRHMLAVFLQLCIIYGTQATYQLDAM